MNQPTQFFVCFLVFVLTFALSQCVSFHGIRRRMMSAKRSGGPSNVYILHHETRDVAAYKTSYKLHKFKYSNNFAQIFPEMWSLVKKDSIVVVYDKSTSPKNRKISGAHIDFFVQNTWNSQSGFFVCGTHKIHADISSNPEDYANIHVSQVQHKLNGFLDTSVIGLRKLADEKDKDSQDSLIVQNSIVRDLSLRDGWTPLKSQLVGSLIAWTHNFDVWWPQTNL